MKKYLFILGLVGTALFTACSTADDLISEDPNGTPPDDQATETALIAEASQNSDVSIALVAGQSRGYTRAPIDPTDVVDGYGKFKTETGRYLGVFCLATGKQTGVSNIPSSIKNCDWKECANNDLVVRLKNVPAIVDAEGFKFWNTTDDQLQYYYYPMASWLKYNFYAYYPRQDDEDGEGHKTLSFTSNQAVEKYYTIDGSQDVIWGMANPPADETPVGAEPYCAKYIRWRESNPNYFPELKFEHKLVQFNFSVKAAFPTDPYYIKTSEPFTTITPAEYDALSEGDKADYESGETQLETKVTDMYISNAIYKLSLVVANKKDESQNGKLGYIKRDGGKLPQMTRLDIKETSTNNNRFDGSDAKALPLTTSAQDAGYIMLPPPEVAQDVLPDHKYRLVIAFKYGGQSNVADIEMEPPTDGFEEGKKYSILVNVKSPLEISAKAVLQEWDDSPASITYNSDNSGS